MADVLERLTNLLALLLSTERPLTLEQIADELAGQYPADHQARRAAFERDKKVLRDEGVPLEVVPTADGTLGYRVDRRRYELPDLGLTDEERRALQLAVAAVHLGTPAGEEALWKLGADGPEPPIGPTANVRSLPALPALYEAVSTRATVRFGYRGETRTVDPWGLVLRERSWYVIGRDHDRDARRTFRVDRIDGDVDLGPPGAFTVPADFDPDEALVVDAKVLGEGELVEARVRVDAHRAAAVVRELGADAVRAREPDGGVVVGVPVRNRVAFRSWVLGLLDHAEVLGPPELRDDLVGWLAAVAGEP